jgi:hypothetical protein
MDATHIADWIDTEREKAIDAAKRNPLIAVAGFLFLGVVLFFAFRKKPEEKKGTTKVIKIIRERLVREDKDMSRRDPKDDTRNADEIAAEEKAAADKAAEEKAAADAAAEKAAAEKAAAEKAEKENKS